MVKSFQGCNVNRKRFDAFLPYSESAHRTLLMYHIFVNRLNYTSDMTSCHFEMLSHITYHDNNYSNNYSKNYLKIRTISLQGMSANN